jgi:N-methylhydantoinase A
VIVPRLASVFSAFGIGFSHLAHVHQVALDGASQDIPALGAELESRARRDMYGEGVDPATCSYTKSLWGAVGEIAVERPLAGKKLKRTDNLSDPRLTVRAVFELPSFTLLVDKQKKYSAVKARGKTAINLGGDKALDVPVVDDSELRPGKEMVGPGLIQGDYLTSIVDAGWRLRVSTNGDLVYEAE